MPQAHKGFRIQPAAFLKISPALHEELPIRLSKEVVVLTQGSKLCKS